MKTRIGRRNVVKINPRYVLKIGEKFESVRPRRLFTEKFAIKKLKQYGVAVPKILSYGMFVDGREYIKMELIKGKKISSNNSVIDIFDAYKNIGAQLKKIPTKLNGFGWINPITFIGIFTTWNKYLYNFVQKYGLRLYKIGILEKSQITTVLKYIDSLPDNFKKAGFIHGDLKPQNLIFNPLNKKVYILDWENVMFGDPLLDLAILKMRFKNPKIHRGFLAGLLNRPLSSTEKKNIDLYSVIAKIGILNFNLKNNLSLSGIYTLNKQIEKLKRKA